MGLNDMEEPNERIALEKNVKRSLRATENIIRSIEKYLGKKDYDYLDDRFDLIMRMIEGVELGTALLVASTVYSAVLASMANELDESREQTIH